MSRSKMIPVLLAAVVVLVAGCSGIPKKDKNGDKNAATAQWRAARATVMVTLARDQFIQGNFDAARSSVTEAVKLLPDNPEIRTLSGRIAFEQGNLELAEAEFRFAQASDPTFAAADYYLGVIMQRWQRLPAALDLYASASQKAPKEVAYVLAQAETLVALDRESDALNLLQSSQKTFENSSEVRAAMGHVLVRQRRHAEAVDMLRQAVMLAPDDEGLRETLAKSLYSAAKYPEALENIERLLRSEKFKNRADLHTLAGECQLALGRPMDARASFETASTLQPANVNFTLNLAKAALEVNDTRRAEIAVRRALALAPTHPQANLLMGYVRMEQNKLPEALAAFRRASDADARDPMPICMAGVVLEKLGRRDEALRQYALALTIKPDDELAKRLMNQLEASAAIGGDR